MDLWRASQWGMVKELNFHLIDFDDLNNTSSWSGGIGGVGDDFASCTGEESRFGV